MGELNDLNNFLEKTVVKFDFIERQLEEIKRQEIPNNISDGPYVPVSGGSFTGNVGFGNPSSVEAEIDLDGAIFFRTTTADRRTPVNSSLIFEAAGITSSWSCAIQDNTGRVSYYWNSTPGPSPTYLEDSEPAVKWRTSTTTLLQILSAPIGLAGDPITWDEEMTVTSSGTTFGTPTGGAKGHGTINAVAIYDDNSLLSPYVLEAARSGSIDMTKLERKIPKRMGENGKQIGKSREHKPARRFAENMVEELDPKMYAEKWKREGHLPALPSESEWEVMGNFSLGKLVQSLMETVEVLAVHISVLEERISENEKGNNGRGNR